eukprot:CFRG4806T1
MSALRGECKNNTSDKEMVGFSNESSDSRKKEEFGGSVSHENSTSSNEHVSRSYFSGFRHMFGYNLQLPQTNDAGPKEGKAAKDQMSCKFRQLRYSAENLFQQARGRISPEMKMKSRGSFQTLTALAAKSDQLFKYNRDDFSAGELIGQGAFGKVYRVVHIQSGNTVVLKVINKNKIRHSHLGIEHMREEQMTLIELSRKDIPFAVKTIGAFQEGEKLYFIMEEVTGGGLFDIIRHAKHHHFTEKIARFYAAECLVFLKCLHTQARVVYRDLKPENLMVDNCGHLVIIDFGLCKHLGKNERTSSFVGTPDYMAPEIIHGRPYSFEVDFWSYGCLVFEMINGYAPFDTKDENGTLTFKNVVKEGHHLRSHRQGVSPEARMLISHLLQNNGQSRLGHNHGWEDVQAHSWFNGLDWESVANKKMKPPKVPKFKAKAMGVQPSVNSEVFSFTEDDEDEFPKFNCVVRLDEPVEESGHSNVPHKPIFSVSFVEEEDPHNATKNQAMSSLRSSHEASGRDGNGAVPTEL